MGGPPPCNEVQVGKWHVLEKAEAYPLGLSFTSPLLEDWGRHEWNAYLEHSSHWTNGHWCHSGMSVLEFEAKDRRFEDQQLCDSHLTRSILDQCTVIRLTLKIIMQCNTGLVLSVASASASAIYCMEMWWKVSLPHVWCWIHESEEHPWVAPCWAAPLRRVSMQTWTSYVCTNA